MEEKCKNITGYKTQTAQGTLQRKKKMYGVSLRKVLFLKCDKVLNNHKHISDKVLMS